jgi:hypothetical protein
MQREASEFASAAEILKVSASGVDDDRKRKSEAAHGLGRANTRFQGENAT